MKMQENKNNGNFLVGNEHAQSHEQAQFGGG